MEQNIFERLNDGLWLRAGANDSPEISERLRRCAETCHAINSLPPSQADKRAELFRGLLGSVGRRPVIHSPFRCDFGCNIHIGDHFVGNFNLSILDEAKVTIGDNVMIGPNCSLITITHALLPDQRREGIMRAEPITIGDDVWIAAGAVILPGVVIGAGAVIGAGSVVVKSVPAGMLAVGNPCRPLRPVTEADKVIPIRL